jgi:hypothetical protein
MSSRHVRRSTKLHERLTALSRIRTSTADQAVHPRLDWCAGRKPVRFFCAWLRLLAVPAVGLLLCAAPAFGQRAPEITVKLSPAEVAEIFRLVDVEAPNTFISSPPQAFWDLQRTVAKAVQANPDALRAVLSARSAAR